MGGSGGRGGVGLMNRAPSYGKLNVNSGLFIPAIF